MNKYTFRTPMNFKEACEKFFEFTATGKVIKGIGMALGYLLIIFVVWFIIVGIYAIVG